MADAEAADREIRNQLDIIQSMIDVSAQRLEGLRTQCATTAELTQQEIRTLEGKLIKLFSDQLIKKLALRSGGADQIPSLIQWLQVVGLSGNSIQGLCQKISTVEELQEKSEHELRTILNDRGARPEELSRLCRALHNLKRYTDALKRGAKDNSDMHLYWDSWDRHQNFKVGGLSPRTSRTRAARASVPSEESLCNNNNRGGAIPPSSSVSSINSLNADRCVLGPPLTPPPLKGKGMKFPTTPPARRKHLTGIQNPVLLSESFPLTKSKSHESQLAKGDNGELPSGEKGSGKRSRLPTEPGPDTDYTSPILTSPIKSPPYNNTGTDSDDNSYKSAPSLQVPKSPRTPTPVGRSMAHQINHRFTKTFKMIATCGYCQKPIYFGAGLKCKECKYTCHRECEDRVTPSCGLPPELLDEFKKKLSCEVQVFPSPNPSRASNTKNIINSLRMRKRSHPQPSINIAPFPPPDSSSNTSSCNSSTPSSPAVTSIPTPHASHKQFHFPDLDPNESYEMPIETDPLNTLHHDQQSRDSDRTASVSGSTDSDKTPVRVDSQESQVSDTETITDGHRWPRQNSATSLFRPGASLSSADSPLALHLAD